MVRRYQLWEGQNRFHCGGRIMLGADANQFFVTIFMTSIPIALFMGLVLPSMTYLGEPVPYLLGVVLGGMLIMTLYYLSRAALTEPGIIPRNPKHVTVPQPVVEGDDHQMIDIKYCTTCNVYRPPRAKHCSYCDNCVDRFDHHCPWTGNCVGQRNYHFFFAFVTWVNVLAITTLVGCIACVSHQADGGDARIGNGTGFLFAISNVPGGTSLGVGIFAILTLFSTLGLWGFHFRLIWIGQTTNELLRGTYRRRINPFNRGCVDNFAVMLCADSPASKLEDLHEECDPSELARDVEAPAVAPAAMMNDVLDPSSVTVTATPRKEGE